MEFAGFRLGPRIGRGALGELHQAVQLALDRPVALRLVDPALVERAERRRCFHALAASVSRLEHPHLVPVYDAGEAEGRCYIATRLLEGTTLEELLASGGRLDTLPALAAAARALVELQRHGLSHGTLAPGKLWIAGGVPLLAGGGWGELLGGGDDLAAMRALVRASLQGLELPAPLAREQTDLAALAASLEACGGELPSLPPCPAATLHSTRRAAQPVSAGPRSFGKYVLIEQLGRGGMGVVYRARQPELGRDVALKLLGDADELELARFLREARAAAALRHPGIVSIHEVGQEQGRHFFTMDLIEGPSLKQRIEEGTLGGEEALRLLAAVCRAVDHAHRQGVIHRDLKPGNILIDEEGRPLVADFGLARVVAGDGPSLTRSGDVFGTPAYMPPEQARGEGARAGARSDVYALGAVLYELLTGTPPFGGESAMQVVLAVLEQEPVPPRQLDRRIHPDLETICLKALEKDPRRRYQTAAELADDLERHLAGEEIAARPIGSLRRLARGLRRRGWQLALLLALVALVAGGGLWWRARRALYRQLGELRPAAAAAYQAGALEQALERYERIAALDPTDDQARQRATDCKRRLTRIAELTATVGSRGYHAQIPIWTELIGLQPKHAVFHVQRGKILLELDRPGDARRDFEAALALAPGEVGALRGLAEVERRARQWVRSAELLRQALAREPRDWLAWLTLAHVLYEQARHADAIRCYDEVLALKQRHPPALVGRARARQKLGSATQALADLDAAIAADPRHAPAYTFRAQLYLARGAGAQAEQDARAAIAIDPRTPGAFHVLGQACEQQKKLDQAEVAYRQAVAAARRAWQVQTAHAVALMRLSRWSEALARLDAAARLDPRQVTIYKNRVTVLLYLRQLERAEADMRQVVALEPVARNYMRLGNLLDKRKKHREAEAAFGRAIELGEVSGLVLRAQMRLRLDDPHGALADLRRTLQQDRDERRLRYARAQIKVIEEHLRRNK